jgi:general secretion pathway protein E
LDIGVPHFLVQATLTGVISQRLVRKICPKCIESYEIDASELTRVGLDVKKQGPVKLYQGAGCARCRGTGYYGRVAIFEALPYTKSLRKITNKDTDLSMLREVAFKEGLVTLRDNAIQKLLDGVTTREEVLRVTWENE